jgi:excisionase family DNA binding protein
MTTTSSTFETRPVFITEKEAAAYLTVSITTMRRWRLNGTGPKSFHTGDIVRYRREDIDAWVDTNSKRVA